MQHTVKKDGLYIAVPNWDFAREFLKKEKVSIEFMGDFGRFKQVTSIITMPDGDHISCSPNELKDSWREAEAYAIAKAFELLTIFKKKGYIESADTMTYVTY